MYKSVWKTGIGVVLKKSKQLHNRIVMGNNNSKGWGEDRRTVTLNVFQIKVLWTHRGLWGQAGGRKQPSTKKDEVSTSTIITEFLLLTCLTDTMQYQDVVTIDISCVFMQTDMEEDDVCIKLEWKMEHLLAQINPKMYR